MLESVGSQQHRGLHKIQVGCEQRASQSHTATWVSRFISQFEQIDGSQNHRTVKRPNSFQTLGLFQQMVIRITGLLTKSLLKPQSSGTCLQSHMTDACLYLHVWERCPAPAHKARAKFILLVFKWNGIISCKNHVDLKCYISRSFMSRSISHGGRWLCLLVFP